MDKFEFTTDRTYDGPQRITGTVVQTVEFHDTARHIRGRAWLPMMPENFTLPQLQRCLMQAYDANQYESI